MSMVVSFFPEVLIPSQSPFLLHPHARLICFYQSVCYMEDLHFVILRLCSGSKHEHLSFAAFPSSPSSCCAFSPTSCGREGNAVSQSTLMSASFTAIILRLVVLRLFRPQFTFLQSSMVEGNMIVVPFNPPRHWKVSQPAINAFHSSSSSSCALCLDQAGLFFPTKRVPRPRRFYHQGFFPSTQKVSTLTSFNLSCRHLAPRWYHSPFCLHQLQDFLPFIRTFGIAGCRLRLRRLSLLSSLSSRGSYCALLPFITSGLPTTYAKLGNGGMSSVDSASLSSSSSSCCASVQCICCAPCGPPTIEVSLIKAPSRNET